MPAWASDTGADFKKLDPGTYAAVCDSVVMLGKQETPWGAKEKVFIRWEVPSERVQYDKDGQHFDRPMSIGSTLTVSLNEKATLGQLIQGWRGKPFTAEELKRFDLFKLLGAPCMLSVVHNESGGKVYANVASVSKLMKGMDAPKPEMPFLKYSPDETQDYDKLPEWVHKKLAAQVIDEPEKLEEGSDTSFEDDSTIPF